MAMGMDMLAIVSICPPSSRPHHADNIIQIGTTLWDLWEYVDELLLNADGEFTETDIWLLTWEVYWDVEEVVEEFGTGHVDPNTGEEETITYSIYELLENAQEIICEDGQWLGDPTLHERDNVDDMALHITATVSGMPIVTLGRDVFNPELTSFVRWRSRLYGGVWTTEKETA